MIVPLSLARDAAALALRKRLITEEGADRWLLFGEDEGVFSGVTQSACIFRAVRGGGRARHLAIRSRGVESRLSAVDIDGTGRHIVPELKKGGAELIEWLRSNCRGRLGDACEMRVGEVDQTFFRDCMRDTDTGCVLARGAHLSPFHLDVEPKPSRERFLDLELFLRMKKGMADACRERASVRRVAQLGIRNLHSRPRLVAAPAPPGVYFGNSLNAYHPAPGIAPEYLAGILNSRLLDWLFRLGSGNNNINLHEMRGMPFPLDATPEQREEVRRAYERCARVAAAGVDTGPARKALDAAVERCFAVPPELVMAVE